MELTLEKTTMGTDKINKLLDENRVYGSTNGRVINEGKEILYRTVSINAKLAEQLLEFNTNNRPPSGINMENLQSQMKKGEWEFSCEPILFDCEGNLINGQHRLKAIIKADVTLTFLVVTGLKREIFKVLDSGRKRTGADILSIEDIPNATAATALCRMIYSYKVGRYSLNRNANRNLTNKQLVDYYKSLNEIEYAVNYGRTLNRKFERVATAANLGGFYFLFAEIDKTQAFDFITQLATGVGITEKSPILALRNLLIKAKTDRKFKLTQNELVKSFVYCWNKYREGKTVVKINLPKDFEILLK